MQLKILQLILITVSDVVITSRQERGPTAQERLYENLLANYSKSSRPVNDPKSAVNLSFTFKLLKIYEVNAKMQRMSVVSFARQEWRDKSLRWNASEYSGFSSINVPPSEIWVPDVGLYNEVENKDHKKTGVTTHVVVYSNGTCRWTYPLFLHAMCAIDVSYFPLDLQKCSLRFGSMTYPSSEVLISQPRLIHVIPVHKNKEWMPYKTSIKTKNIWDDTRMNNFSVVEITLNMERDSLYFFIEMLVPCFLISCLTILGFVLPPESGERMSLGMLILLAMTFFQQLTMKMVPLQDFPLISQYFLVTTVEIGIALLITTLTLNFYYHSHSKMPGFMKLIILNFLGKVTRICPLSEDKIQQTKMTRSLKLSERKFQLSSSSREISSEFQFDIELTETASARNDFVETDLNDSTVGLVSFKSTDENSSTSSSLRKPKKNEDVLDYVDQNRIEEGPRDWNKDWVLASRIIDRFSMYTAVVIGILTVLIVFLRAPRFWSSRTGLDE